MKLAPIKSFSLSFSVASRIRKVLLCSLLGVASVVPVAGADKPVGSEIPPLDQVREMALKYFSEGSTASTGEPQTKADVIYKTEKAYYQLQLKGEQLGIAREVKKHFENAVTQAGEKLESEDAEVTQTAVTKLKLGLTGTLHDIVQFESETKQARLALGRLLGVRLPADRQLADKKFRPVPFAYGTVEAYLANHRGADPQATDSMREAFIKVVEMRDKMRLVEKSRKIVRVLLVTEVANYDFGIGDEGEIFEALIIYTRVLSGYYESVYHYNLAVSALHRQAAE